MTTTSSHLPHSANPRDRLTGIACGMGAGALWGLVFLAPELLAEFSPIQQSIGRYLAYGSIAAALLARRWRSLGSRISRGQWLNLTWLAFAGNTFYYILMANAVQHGGIAMTSLIIGFLPVVITIIGSRDRGAVPLRKLLPSLLLCAVGAACIGWQALTDSPSPGSFDDGLIGLLCALGALVSWTAFAVGNTRSLRKLERISPHDWNLLLGVATGAQNLLLIPLALVLETVHHSAEEWVRLGAVSVGLAILASFIGNVLWNKMSRLLPLTLVGQMILFETLFALIYGFLWERRLPTPLEIGAMISVVLGVMSCVAVHRRSELR